MKRKAAAVLLAGAAIIASAAMAFTLAVWQTNRRYAKQAAPLIQAAESFEQTHGRPAVNETELGWFPAEENNGPFYRLTENECWEVYFATGFDEERVYDSALRRWTNRP
ncbi:MAG: hypothetical protein ACI37O_08015 [Candidatus Avelusimicrobium sp.]|uniref:hypothetical protein n=1 Tax=Candidatus Avelusimicrobium sp. TaxID=3048833 RepID=UPI003F10FE29